MTYGLIAAVATVCYVLRAAVPLVLRRRGPPASLERRLGRATLPLLAALASVQLLSNDGRVGLDWRVAGVLAAGGLYVWRRSLPLAMVLAAATTGVARLLLG